MASSRKMRNSLGSVFGLFALFLVGCGGGDGDRGHVSGTINLEGKPVPAGRIYFDPDITKKNKGPQGFAEISDGEYDTGSSGKGASLGAVVVRIEGFDGKVAEGKPYGNMVFEYKTAMVLEDGDTKNFNLKASEVQRAKVQIGPGP